MARAPMPGLGASGADANDQRVRAAWLYYVEGLTQEQVAARLGISRVRVLRWLASARADGTVQIRINARSRDQISLENRLQRAFGLETAIVVPAPSDKANTPLVVGQAAGAFLSEALADGQSIGIGWGETLGHSLRAVERRPLAQVSIVSLLGGLTHASGLNPSTVAWRLAEYLGAECYQITGPVVATDEPMRDALWRHPGLAEVRERARQVDLAIVSVGDIDRTSTLFRNGLLTADDARSLREAGAVGDLLCHFVDPDGALVDHAVNRRVMALAPAELRQMKRVALVSGGAAKVAAIRAALRATQAAVLITDADAAEGLLALVADGL